MSGLEEWQDLHWLNIHVQCIIATGHKINWRAVEIVVIEENSHKRKTNNHGTSNSLNRFRTEMKVHVLQESQVRDSDSFWVVLHFYTFHGTHGQKLSKSRFSGDILGVTKVRAYNSHCCDDFTLYTSFSVCWNSSIYKRMGAQHSHVDQRLC